MKGSGADRKCYNISLPLQMKISVKVSISLSYLILASLRIVLLKWDISCDFHSVKIAWFFVPGGGDVQQWRGRQPWERHHQRNQPCTCRSHCQRQEQQRLRHTSWWVGLYRSGTISLMRWKRQKASFIKHLWPQHAPHDQIWSQTLCDMGKCPTIQGFLVL